MSNPQFSEGKKFWPEHEIKAVRCRQLHRHADVWAAERCDQQHEAWLIRQSGIRPHEKSKLPPAPAGEQTDLFKP